MLAALAAAWLSGAGVATVTTQYAVKFAPVCKVVTEGPAEEWETRHCKLKLFLPRGAKRSYLIDSPWLTAEYVDGELRISCGEHMRCTWVDRE